MSHGFAAIFKAPCVLVGARPTAYLGLAVAVSVDLDHDFALPRADLSGFHLLRCQSVIGTPSDLLVMRSGSLLDVH